MSPRVLIRFLLLPFLVMFAATWCGGCGASQRERAIKTTLATVNTARDAFVEIDRATQAGIVAVAPNYDRGLQLLQAYKEKRERVVDAFTLAYRAIATAATLDSDRSLAEMLSAAAGVADAIRDFKKGGSQ